MNPLDNIPTTPDGLITVTALSRVFGVSLRALSRAIASGVFPNGVVKRGPGNLRHLHRADVEAALLNNRFPHPLKR